ncbi:hypothetical protein [Staphylococcus aureus]|uniref:hypothetical protein n=1 Tax=Staphylococcus aureus TaxID=1280 RepID=UPI0035B7547A
MLKLYYKINFATEPLLIQSNAYIDIGQREFNKLLLMLFSAEEYGTAHTLTKNYLAYSVEAKKPKVARIPKTNKF